MKFKLQILSLLLCGGLTCDWPVAAQEDYQPVVGTLHADFVLPRIDNDQAVALTQYRGTKVLLIHFASW